MPVSVILALVLFTDVPADTTAKARPPSPTSRVAAADSTGTVEGRVWDWLHGCPVESAQVTVLGFGATARTRADGFYRIEQVPVGRWDILSEARQYRGYLKLGARIPGGPPIRLNFLLTPVAHVSGDTSPECETLSLAPVGIPGAGIDGIVTDSETGDPIVGAAVVVDGTDFGAPTDETGRYHIPEVPSGSWRLTTGAVGYYPKSQDSVEVRKHSGARVDFRLRFHPIDYRRSVQVR